MRANFFTGLPGVRVRWLFRLIIARPMAASRSQFIGVRQAIVVAIVDDKEEEGADDWGAVRIAVGVGIDTPIVGAGLCDGGNVSLRVDKCHICMHASMHGHKNDFFGSRRV
jgi:hypothetical protein